MKNKFEKHLITKDKQVEIDFQQAEKTARLLAKTNDRIGNLCRAYLVLKSDSKQIEKSVFKALTHIQQALP